MSLRLPVPSSDLALATPAPHRSATTDGVRWTVLAALVSAPLAAAILFVLYHTPYSLSEVVAVLSDAESKSFRQLLLGDGVYFRPVFWGLVKGIWVNASSVNAALATYRVLHLGTVVALFAAFFAICRPRSARDVAAFSLAFAALIAPGGFRDNLENLPLNQTLMVMVLAAAAVLLLRYASRWNTWLALGLTALAVCTKEQGLAVPAMLIAGALTGAPGLSRRGALAVGALTAAYVAARLLAPGEWPVFMRSIGLGFREIEDGELMTRFADQPYVIYAYNIMATMGNVLLGEPSRGIFHATRDTLRGTVTFWQVNQVLGTAAMTVLIAVWARAAWSGTSASPDTDRRVLALFASGLVVSSVLGYNYTRDRFGGVPVVLYAVCVYFAASWALQRARGWAARGRAPAAILLVMFLVTLAGSWHMRAAGSVQYQRRWAWMNRKEWLVNYFRRSHMERYQHATYITLMNAMWAQGTDPDVPSTDSDPAWVGQYIDGPW